MRSLTRYSYFGIVLCSFLFSAPNLDAADYSVGAPTEQLINELKLDPFYKKTVVIGGFAIVASEKVSDFALKEAAFVLDKLLEGRDDIRKALVKGRVHFGILAPNEFTTDMPEYRNLKPKEYWDKRARGLGATVQIPLVSGGEENVLAYEGDPYRGENILIHEFAHAIHGVGLLAVDPTFDDRLNQIYKEAIKVGLWKNTYGETNRHEYFAEGVQSYFDCNQSRNPQHNGIRTREQLKEYDPRLEKIIAEVFKENPWRYVPPSQRKENSHLKGYDPKKSPKFAWPKELLDWNRKNVGDGTIRGKFKDSEIVIRSSARFAGAIESITWNGKEFIDRVDHGRLLQSASNLNGGKKFHPEVFNPTEGGSRRDGNGPFSSSNLFRFQAERSLMTSINQMAFWLAPDEKTPDHEPALNQQVLSDHWLSKRVQIGYQKWPNVLDYTVTFTLPETEKHTFAQFEAVTGYMPAEFKRFWKLDPQQKELQPLSDGPGEQPFPVILATENGSHAMGIYSPDQPSKGFEKAGYGRFRFTKEQVVKWNVVFRIQDAQGIKPDRYTFHNFVILGSLADVEKTMRELIPGKREGK